MIAAELVRPVPLPRIVSAVVAAIAIAVVWSNIDAGLTYGYRFLRDQSGFAEADIEALEIGRKWAPPDLQLVVAIARNPFLSGITAGRLFAETRAHGQLPAYSIAQLTTAAPRQRQSADGVLAFAERLAPTVTASGPAATKGCVELQTGATGQSPELALTPGTRLLSDVGSTGLAIGVRRIAPPNPPSYIGLIAQGTTERLTIPQDAISLPWRLSIKSPAAGALDVCP